MMIEVIPFFHLLAEAIVDIIGEDKPEQVIPTTMVAFSLSAVMTGWCSSLPRLVSSLFLFLFLFCVL